MEKTNNKNRSNISGVLAAVLLFLLLGIVGGCMIFVPDMQMIYFCYIAGGVFLTYGSYLVIRYFAKKEYEMVSNYHFSVGLLILIMALVTLIRAEEVVQIITIYLGIMVLVEGVILLQHTIQMKHMQGTWWLTLVFATVLIVFSILMLLAEESVLNDYANAFYVFLFSIGIIGVISQIVVAIQTNRYHRELELKKEVALQEEAEVTEMENLEEKEDTSSQLEE